MAYQIGNIVAGADYNALIGAQGTSVYASQSAVNSAAPAIGALYGAGYGDRGYGQTGITLAAVSSGAMITAAQWLSLRNALATVRESQTGSVPSAVPPANLFDPGDLVEAHESSAPTSDAYDFNSEISAADTNRFTANSTSSGNVSGTNSATRSGTWGGAGGGIQLIFDVTLPSTDEARYFFNSGGEFRINLSQPGATAQDTNWNNALVNRLGQIRVNRHGVTTSGSLALSAALGYFEATSGVQSIFNDVAVGTSPYAANLLRVQYQALGSAANGGPGNGLRFTIRLIDAHTNSFTDVVSAGTLATFTFAKNSYLASPAIVSPTGSLNTAWTAV